MNERARPTLWSRNSVGPEPGGWGAVLPSFVARGLGLGTWRRPFRRRNGPKNGGREGDQTRTRAHAQMKACTRRRHTRLALPICRGAFSWPAEYHGQRSRLMATAAARGAGKQWACQKWRSTMRCRSEAADMTSSCPVLPSARHNWASGSRRAHRPVRAHVG